MLRIGLTGGTASGKSAAAAVFAELGVPVIDSDVIAREVVAPGSPGLAAIRGFFDDLIDYSLGDGRRFGCLVTNTSIELAAHDDEVGAIMRTGLGRVEQAFRRTLERAGTEGELAPGQDLRALTRFLLATVNGIRVLARANPDEAMLRDVVDTALSVLRRPAG